MSRHFKGWGRPQVWRKKTIAIAAWQNLHTYPLIAGQSYRISHMSFDIGGQAYFQVEAYIEGQGYYIPLLYEITENAFSWHGEFVYDAAANESLVLSIRGADVGNNLTTTVIIQNEGV